jgi:hypothetical protein
MARVERRVGAPRPAPGLEALLHPLPLAALALLLVNDHVFKVRAAGFVSGKLSDVAVLILLPFVLLAGWELLRLRRTGLAPVGPRLVGASVIFTIAIYVAIEIVPVASDVYRVGLGAVQWPFRALLAVLQAAPVPALAPVQLTSDVTDLFVVPVALIVLVVGPWRRSRAPSRASR